MVGAAVYNHKFEVNGDYTKELIRHWGEGGWGWSVAASVLFAVLVMLGIPCGYQHSQRWCFEGN